MEFEQVAGIATKSSAAAQITGAIAILILAGLSAFLYWAFHARKHGWLGKKNGESEGEDDKEAEEGDEPSREQETNVDEPQGVDTQYDGEMRAAVMLNDGEVCLGDCTRCASGNSRGGVCGLHSQPVLKDHLRKRTLTVDLAVEQFKQEFVPAQYKCAPSGCNAALRWEMTTGIPKRYESKKAHSLVDYRFAVAAHYGYKDYKDKHIEPVATKLHKQEFPLTGA